MFVRRNIIANYLGQGWNAFMGLVFVPLYIRYLGVEAYGLIGLFAVIQAWMQLLDMGITPTLNREMARFTTGSHSPQSIWDLLHSLEVLCFSLAVFIGISVLIASNYLASDWLKADGLSMTDIAHALSVMAIVIALRFVENIYRGSLLGLQRQVWYNGVDAMLATIRNGGAVAVLAWVAPTVQTFFFWQAISSLLSLTVFAAKVHRTLPHPPSPPRFSRDVLKGVWQFAGGMMGITFVALLLTQIDKVLLSRLLPLKLFGYYAIAASLASIPYLIISPITAAIYPSMVQFITQDNQSALVSIYHKGAQLGTILTTSAATLLSCFAADVVFMWSGDVSLAENTAPILSVLVVGTFLNGLMWMPYQLQLAHGWTNLVLKGNIIGVVVLIPAIFLAVPHYGALAAAWIWVIVNAGYILIAIQFMHRKIISKEKWQWYLSDVLLPVSGAVGIVLLAKIFRPESYQNRWNWLAFFLISSFFALTASAALASRIRCQLLTFMARFFHSRCFLL